MLFQFNSFFLKSISYSILEGKEAAKDYAAAAKHGTKDTVAEKGSGKQLIASFYWHLLFSCVCTEEGKSTTNIQGIKTMETGDKDILSSGMLN